jgi:DNA-binding CsgD family transcriptional regulator
VSRVSRRCGCLREIGQWSGEPGQQSNTLSPGIGHSYLFLLFYPSCLCLVREFQRQGLILHLVAEGLSNKEIGESLHISESTVKNHLRNILAKLHLKNRIQLIAYAYKNGLIRD